MSVILLNRSSYMFSMCFAMLGIRCILTGDTGDPAAPSGSLTFFSSFGSSGMDSMSESEKRELPHLLLFPASFLCRARLLSRRLDKRETYSRAAFRASIESFKVD